MATLGSTFAISAWGMSGGEKKKEQGPPINASSKEEEQFIQCVNHRVRLSRGPLLTCYPREFIKAAEDESKAKH